MSKSKLNNKSLYDCLIIGGGPAGLLAGVYLARYRRRVAIIEDEHPRTSYIPLSHNYPGADKGISGKQITNTLKKQLKAYSIDFYKDSIQTLSKTKKNFTATGFEKSYSAKKIILATGMSNREPNIPSIKTAFLEGLIRHCMICDAYEVIDKKVAIIGHSLHALEETLFLLTYTKEVSLFTLGINPPFHDKIQKKFQQHKIKLYTDIVQKIYIRHNKIHILYGQNSQNSKILVFDCLYSALGYFGNSTLVKTLQAKLDKNRCIITDNDQQSSISGLYAIGDVAVGLKQIVNGYAQAAIAATAIHKKLPS